MLSMVPLALALDFILGLPSEQGAARQSNGLAIHYIALIVALLKGTVAKAKHGNNAEMSEMVIIFYHFILYISK